MGCQQSTEGTPAPAQVASNVKPEIKEPKEAVKSSKDSVNDQINSGNFLKLKTMKYWVDRETGHKCIMMFARSLSITWSEDPRYWCWLHLEETSNGNIEVASLLDVCWLEIHGKLEVSYLTPGISYEVVFIVMMSEPTYGWNTPINLRIKLPDGSIQEHKESLQEKPREKWTELKVGELRTQAEQEGEMEVSLFEYGGGQWKRGLMVKGIVIRPKKP